MKKKPFTLILLALLVFLSGCGAEKPEKYIEQGDYRSAYKLMMENDPDNPLLADIQEKYVQQVIDEAKPFTHGSLVNAGDELNQIGHEKPAVQKVLNSFEKELYEGAQKDGDFESVRDILMYLDINGDYYALVKESLSYYGLIDCLAVNRVYELLDLSVKKDQHPEWKDFNSQFEAALNDLIQTTDFLDSSIIEESLDYILSELETTSPEEYDTFRALVSKYRQAREIEESDPVQSYDLYNNILEEADVESPLYLLAYKQSSSMKDISNYMKACSCLEEKKYLEAYELFKKLDYEDSKEKAKEAAYAYGEMLFEGQNYQDAFDTFHNLGEYLDAQEKAASCCQEFPETSFLSNKSASGPNKLIIKNSYEDGLLFYGTRVEGVDKESSIWDNLDPRNRNSLNTPGYTKTKEYNFIDGTLSYTDEKFCAFVRSGEEISISLKKGYYAFTAYTGNAWFGSEDKLGKNSKQVYTTPTTKVYNSSGTQCLYIYNGAISLNRVDKSTFTFNNGDIK